MHGVEIAGYEGLYSITSDGRVWSVKRYCKAKNNGFRLIGGRFLKPLLGDQGYFLVKLSKLGNTKTIRIHQLVASAFVPKTSDVSEINHKSGVKTDNRAENLEWVSHSGNMQHAWDLGLVTPRGKKAELYKIAA